MSATNLFMRTFPNTQVIISAVCLLNIIELEGFRLDIDSSKRENC